jgi:hypothetical protein
MHLLMALIALVVFQMIGGMTDFYRSYRGVKMTTELMLLLQNWTLSLIFSAGLVAFNSDFDNSFSTYLCWYLLTSVGMVTCRSLIRFSAGWLRNRGYNKRYVAVAGDLPVGLALMESFRNEPWLGFDVVGVYHDAKPGGVTADWAGNYDQLIEDAKAGKIHNVYLAIPMSEEGCIKKLMREPQFFHAFQYRHNGIDTGYAVAGVGGGVRRIELGGGENTFLEAALNLCWIQGICQIAGHQWRKVMPGRYGGEDAIAISNGGIDSGDWRYQVRHDNRAAIDFAGIRHDGVEHIAITQMDMPVVRTADFQNLGLCSHWCAPAWWESVVKAVFCRTQRICGNVFVCTLFTKKKAPKRPGV